MEQHEKKSPAAANVADKKEKLTKEVYKNKNLQTDPPLAEKDEVKKAEERTMKKDQ